MTAAVATALVLQCFFTRPTDGLVPADSIPAVKVPVAGAIADSLVARQPPVSTGSFEGEAGGQREWRFAGSGAASAPTFKVLRVSLSRDLALPSPYAARFGTVTVAADRHSSRFEQQLTGWCKLDPAESTAQ